MGEAIGELKIWMQDFAFTRRIQNFVIMCPNALLQGESEVEAGAAKIKSFWSAGPVHMAPEGYSCLATSLVSNLFDLKLARPTEVKASSSRAASQVDRAAARNSWVLENDSCVHRTDDEPNGQRGRYNWRGGQRGGTRGGGHSWRGGGTSLFLQKAEAVLKHALV
jgi:uncharacterized membrane protein YgcG